jgi:hypothetical protein
MNAWSAAAATLAIALLVASALVPVWRTQPPMASDADLTLWGSLEELPAEGTLVIDSPGQAYGRDEAAALDAFLERGGRVVVIEATPAAASLVHALGLGIEATPALVFDPDVDASGAFQVHATGALGVTRDTTLPRAQVVLGGTPVLAMSPFAWRDDDRDGSPGLEEPRGAWSVVATQDAGEGAILVVGARSLLSEGPAAAPLTAWMTERGPLISDAGHVARDDPLGSTALLAGERPTTVALGLLAAGLVAAAVAWRVRLRRVGSKRRRGAVDRQTLEILAELEP